MTDLQSYLKNGVEKLVKSAIKATLKNPKESAFMLRFSKASKRAAERRDALEQEGEHIPPFLISSITSSCNLHCAGCYSRCNHATTDEAPVEQLSDAQWGAIFDEAQELGISFILLAGGEPLLRRGVIEEAAKRRDIMFPIFTNGTFMNQRYLELFDKNRNLIPIMSIEGEKEETDSRRGEGVYDSLMTNMDELQQRGLIFGASVTVTTENIHNVTSEAFLRSLEEKGCKAVIYVEYVPVTEESQHLAPGDAERDYLAAEIERLRAERQEMVYVSFPGDEKTSGGCIAAGRGFFHINSHGGAEPCPFSPYSDINVAQSSIRQALQSKLFRGLKDAEILMEDHAGGCVLYEKRDQVEALLQ